MTRNITALIGFVLLAGCSGGGGDSSTSSTAPPPPTPTAQPDMLTATSQGLLVGKANGQGQHLIVREPNLHQSSVVADQGHVVYQRASNAGNIFNAVDIWTVRTDGTGDRALLNTANGELLHAVSWPWVFFGDLDDWKFKSLNTETQAQFPIGKSGVPNSVDIKDARVIFGDVAYLYSATFTGTDLISYGDGGDLATPFIVQDRLVFVQQPPTPSPLRLLSVPIRGGTPIPLDDEQPYLSFAGSLGSRVVLHNCATTGPCDVASVNSDGSAPVVLASDPANEAVQGLVGDQVIIRRNLSGNDQLIAVPIAGGPERLLMTMTDNEFVQLTTTNLIVVKRPSGTWSLNINGELTKLSPVVGEYPFIAVGDAFCMTKVTAVWCMPLDGSGPAVKIADEGRVVGVL